MIGFMTGGLIPAFGAVAEEFDVSLDTAVYTVSAQVSYKKPFTSCLLRSIELSNTLVRSYY